MVLGDLTTLIRSKNAGAFWLTIDIMFDDAQKLDQVVESGAITTESMSRLFRVDPSDCKVIVSQPALAIKVSFPRPVPSGSWSDTDMVGGQQYAPLLTLPIEGSK